MKRGGWLSRLKGRTSGTDPFAEMGAPPRGRASVQSSPVGVPVGQAPAPSSTPSGPAPDGSTGQFARSGTAQSPSEPRAERPQAPDHGREAARVADAWGNVCDHFALQVMLLAEHLRPALDQLEDDEQDPDRLDRLYTVDHAITRIRRAARDLRVLSGRGDDDTAGPTSSLVDTIRVALSSIERYTQVSIGAVAELAVVGYVADDVASLLAALLDNATRYSPTTVTISGHLVSDGGVMFRIEDNGIGLTAPHVAALNTVLDADVPEIDDHTARHTGFAVVHRLARKHGIRVRLASRSAPVGSSGGTTAMVTVPASVLTEIPDPPLAMAPVVSEPDESESDSSATAHLTVARPARRGPVAAVPDDAEGERPAEAWPDERADDVPVVNDHTADEPAESDASVESVGTCRHDAQTLGRTPSAGGSGEARPPGPAQTLPPLPRREPASLRGADTPKPVDEPPEPAEDAAEQRRAFAEEIAAFSAALGAAGEAPADDVADDVSVDDVPADDEPADTVEPPAATPDHPHDSEEQVP